MRSITTWFSFTGKVLLLCLTLASCQIPQPSFDTTTSDPTGTDPVLVTQTVPTPHASDTLHNAYEQVGNACNQAECLFTANQQTEPPLGIAMLKGYYEAREIDFAMGPQSTPDVEICDGFVITEGSEEIIQWFTELVKAGNTVNRITGQNQLVLSLFLDMLSEQEQAKIRSSTSTEPIEILILIPTPPARGPLTKCITWVEILKVK